MSKKVRYSGHAIFNDVLKQDWMNAIALSPDAFDASLYRPVESETAIDDSYQEESTLEIDTNQDSLSYDESIDVMVLDCPTEQDTFFVTDSGESSLGEGEGLLLLRVNNDNVPIGSVLEWDEETGDGIRTVWWYVQKHLGYGTANVGVLHACVPMRDFNTEDEQTDEEAEETAEDAAEAQAGEVESEELEQQEATSEPEPDNDDVMYL